MLTSKPVLVLGEVGMGRASCRADFDPKPELGASASPEGVRPPRAFSDGCLWEADSGCYCQHPTPTELCGPEQITSLLPSLSSPICKVGIKMCISEHHSFIRYVF